MTRAGLAWICCLAAGSAWGREVPSFSTSVEMVRLDVSVTRDGQSVKGLRAEDFVIRDNGRPQSVELIGEGEKRIHAVLALDNSSSVAGERLSHLKAAAHALVEVLRADDSVSLLTFSDRIRLRVAPDQPRELAHEAIDATRAERTTALRDAVFAAVTLADPARGRPVVLVFSDGEDVGSWLSAEQVLKSAAASDLVVHVIVSARKGAELEFLQELGASTGGEVWRTDDEGLKDALLRALEEFRGRYTLQYSLEGAQPEGWHRIAASVRTKGVKVRARKGYLLRK